MCVGIGQLELKLSKTFKGGSDLEGLKNSIADLNPMSNRVKMWSKGIIIPQENPDIAREATFAWMTKDKKGIPRPTFNTRVEGYMNKGNDPKYMGPYGIFGNPYVEELIMNQRCIIPADFFIEQPDDKKDKRKFLIKREDGEALMLAGIYNEVVNEKTGEISTAFSIMTTAQTAITAKAHHKRSPVIIPPEYVGDFLSHDATQEHLEAFFPPPESEGMIGHEVDIVISKRDCPYEDNDPKLVEPIAHIYRT